MQMPGPSWGLKAEPLSVPCPVISVKSKFNNGEEAGEQENTLPRCPFLNRIMYDVSFLLLSDFLETFVNLFCVAPLKGVIKSVINIYFLIFVLN